MSKTPNKIPVDPEKALVEFREAMAKDANITGPDGLPVHWLVKDTEYGLLICDSAYLLAKYNFSGIQVRVQSEQLMLQPEDMAPILEKFLGWMALNIPQTETWGVEFRQGCPIIPTGREVIGV